MSLLFKIRWTEYWSFSFSISASNEYSGLISLEWTGWISLQSKGLPRVFSNITVQKHQFFGTLEHYTQINFHQAMSSHVTHICNYFWWEF